MLIVDIISTSSYLSANA